MTKVMWTISAIPHLKLGHCLDEFHAEAPGCIVVSFTCQSERSYSIVTRDSKGNSKLASYTVKGPKHLKRVPQKILSVCYDTKPYGYVKKNFPLNF